MDAQRCMSDGKSVIAHVTAHVVGATAAVRRCANPVLRETGLRHARCGITLLEAIPEDGRSFGLNDQLNQLRELLDKLEQGSNVLSRA